MNKVILAICILITLLLFGCDNPRIRNVDNGKIAYTVIKIDNKYYLACRDGDARFYIGPEVNSPNPKVEFLNKSLTNTNNNTNINQQ